MLARKWLLCVAAMLMIVTFLWFYWKAKKDEDDRIEDMVEQLTIGVCAQMRREGHILIEWLEYHSLIGVDNFYLYVPPDMGKTENQTTRLLLKPYMTQHRDTNKKFPAGKKEGEPGAGSEADDWLDVDRRPSVLVFHQVRERPGENPQSQSYQHCLEHFAADNTWLFFIDIDEFIAFPQGFNLKSKLARRMRQYHQDSMEVAGICMPWLNMMPAPPYNSPTHQRSDSSMLLDIIERSSSVFDQGKLGVYVPQMRQLGNESCRWSSSKAPSIFVHNCFSHREDATVVNSLGIPTIRERCEPSLAESNSLAEAGRSDRDLLLLYHFFTRTCYEWVNELIPKRLYWNDLVGFQLALTNSRFQTNYCSSMSAPYLTTDAFWMKRFLPHLKRRVENHPLWGKPIVFV